MAKICCNNEKSRYLCPELLKAAQGDRHTLLKLSLKDITQLSLLALAAPLYRGSKEGGFILPSRVWEELVTLFRVATRIPGPRQEESNNSRRVGLTFTLVAGGVSPLSEWLGKINTDLSGRRKGIRAEKERRAMSRDGQNPCLGLLRSLDKPDLKREWF